MNDIVFKCYLCNAIFCIRYKPFCQKYNFKLLLYCFPPPNFKIRAWCEKYGGLELNPLYSGAGYRCSQLLRLVLI